VGGGLAGSCLALELLERGKDILLIDNQLKNSSSRVAAGLLNPIVPKGVRKTWQCDIIFPALFNYYRHWEEVLQNHFIDNYPFLNIHANIGEALEWEKRMNDPEMSAWLSRSEEHNQQQPMAESATWVNHCGRLDVSAFLQSVQRHLINKNQYVIEEFIHSKCEKTAGGWQYGNEVFESVVCCEGIGLLENPWFEGLFMDPTGGDILKVHIPNIGDKPMIIKQKQWIVPTQERDIYLIGSNFHKNNRSTEPEEKDAIYLMERATQITKQPVTLLEHRRGIRPTVQQRRPYLGEHRTEKRLFIFNGLGAKGSSLCSWLAPMMADHIVFGRPLHAEVDIQRFES
jgi:glycine/D-amino acid oxidase-like deaminating enzyme